MKTSRSTRRTFLKIAAAFPAVLAMVPSFAQEDEKPLEVGLARVDITPPLSFPMAGYYSVRLSTGTHDPLWAKVVCFRKGGIPCVLMICDTISINESVTTEIRKRIHEKTGLPAGCIVITATHTHTGPIRDAFDPNLTPEQNLEFAKAGNYKEFRYSNWWVEKGTEAILTALSNFRPAALSVGEASVPDLSYNRRFFMKDSDEVRFNPGIKNPNIIRPAGPIDPQMYTIFMTDPAAGKPFASLTNFALHLDTTGGTLFSADYPYYIECVLQEKFGADFISFFGTGTCGDINHIDVSGENRRKAPDIGTELGKRIAAAYDNLVSANEKPDVGVRMTTISCRRQEFTSEEVAAAEAMKDAIFHPEVGNYTFLERVKAGKVLNLSKLPLTFQVDIQCIRLSSDTAVVALPGEVFVDLGLEIKKRSPFKNTLILELSQMNAQYVPTQKAFREGSYETINSLFVPGTGELFVEEALNCLEDLRKSIEKN